MDDCVITQSHSHQKPTLQKVPKQTKQREQRQTQNTLKQTEQMPKNGRRKPLPRAIGKRKTQPAKHVGIIWCRNQWKQSQKEKQK